MPTLSPQVTPYYGGGQVANPADVIRVSGAPSSAAVDHNLGTLAVDPTNENIYGLVSKAGGQATWAVLGGNSGYPISPYVVGPSGQAGYQTIQSAINAAAAAGGGVVYVQPGTYTENLTFPAEVITQIVGAVAEEDSGNVQLTGVHTPSADGNISIRNFQLNSATSIFSSNAAGSSRISLVECTFNVTDGWTFNLPNWTGSFHINDCGTIGTNDGVVNNSGSADIFFNNCQVGAGATRTFTTNGSQIRLDLTYVVPPISITGSGLALGLLTVFGNTLTVGGSVDFQSFLGDFLDAGTSNPALVTTSSVPVILNQVSIDSTATNVIQGTGTVNLNQVGFSTNSQIAGTVTVASTTVLQSANAVFKGNLTLQAAGNKINIATGSNASIGTSSAMTAGTITISTTVVTASSKIFLSVATPGGTQGTLSVGTIVAGTSFVINSSSNTDTSTVNWWIIN